MTTIHAAILCQPATVCGPYAELMKLAGLSEFVFIAGGGLTYGYVYVETISHKTNKRRYFEVPRDCLELAA